LHSLPSGTSGWQLYWVQLSLLVSFTAVYAAFIAAAAAAAAAAACVLQLVAISPSSLAQCPSKQKPGSSSQQLKAAS
jgi:hypothetical protein